MSLQPLCPALDIHVHPLRCFSLWRGSDLHSDVQRLLAAADRNGVAKLCLFDLGVNPPYEPDLDQLREANDTVAQIHQLAADRILPFVYVSPAFPEASVAEIDRCIEQHGFVGIKLWVARRATDPGLDPIMQAAARHAVPVLQHAWLKTSGNLPHESTPADVADLARRHPQVNIIMAHLNGCGLRGIEEVADTPNVVVDTSGGDPDSGLVEAAVATLGRHRVVYGSDAPVRHFGVSIGKVMGANLPDEVKRDILWNNAVRLLPARAGLRPCQAAASPSAAAPSFPAAGCIVDIGAWIGSWPTLPVHGGVADVHKTLHGLGVGRMHVSPLNAAWAHNAHLHNDEVYQAADHCADLCPLPILDPTIASWRRELARAAQDPRVKLIRLMPGFAPCDLDRADALCAAAGEASLAVVVQSRMDHPGRHHPLARVKAVAVAEVLALARRHPRTTVIIGGLAHTDLAAALKAMQTLANLYADTSQLDGFDTLHDACAPASATAALASGRLLFGSHVPLFVGFSALARIVNDLPAAAVRQILAANAATLGL